MCFISSFNIHGGPRHSINLTNKNVTTWDGHHPLVVISLLVDWADFCPGAALLALPLAMHTVRLKA